MAKKKRRSREFKRREEERNEAARLAAAEQAREERKRQREQAAEELFLEQAEKAEKRENRKRLRAQLGKRLRMYSVLLLALLAVLGVSLLTVYRVRNERDAVLDENEALSRQKERLELELSNVESEEYVEQEAREVLRMTRPGEVLYILPKNGETIEDYSGRLSELQEGAGGAAEGMETARFIVTMPDGTEVQGGAVGLSPAA